MGTTVGPPIALGLQGASDIFLTRSLFPKERDCSLPNSTGQRLSNYSRTAANSRLLRFRLRKFVRKSSPPSIRVHAFAPNGRRDFNGASKVRLHSTRLMRGGEWGFGMRAKRSGRGEWVQMCATSRTASPR